MLVLKDLPNTDGFEFVGVGLNGERWPCVVKKSPLNLYTVYRRDTDEACWFRLYGWERSPVSANERP